jgi:hypothetical protein
MSPGLSVTIPWNRESSALSCSFNAMREKEKNLDGIPPSGQGTSNSCVVRNEASLGTETPLAVTAEFMRKSERTLLRVGYSPG